MVDHGLWEFHGKLTNYIKLREAVVDCICHEKITKSLAKIDNPLVICYMAIEAMAHLKFI